jgi:hypothetical protein
MIMADYTEAARRRDTAILADGSTVILHLNPAGKEGWQIDVIYAYDDHGDMMFWNTHGTAFASDPVIVGIK